MSSFKMQSISHSEYLSGKYKNVSSSSGNHEAKIWYKDNGSIDEDSTYSDNYLRSNGLGRYAKKAETSSSKSSHSKSSSSSKSSSNGSSLFGSSSKNSSSSSTSSKTSNSNTSSYMEREESYQEIEARLTNERLGKYINNLVDNCCDIYDEEIIEKTRALGEEIGINGDEAVAELQKSFKRSYDPEFIMKYMRLSIVPTMEGYHGREAKIPSGCKKALMHYMRCALNYDYIKKGENVKEWMKNLETVIKLHYNEDFEVFELYAKLKEQVELKKQRIRKVFKIIGIILLSILFILFLGYLPIW